MTNPEILCDLLMTLGDLSLLPSGVVGESSPRSEEESGCLAPLAWVPDILLQQESPLVSVDAGDKNIGYLGMKTRVPKAITVILLITKLEMPNSSQQHG